MQGRGDLAPDEPAPPETRVEARTWLLRAALLLGACEIATFAVLVALARLDRLPPTEARLSEPQREAVERLLAGEARYVGHDPRLGWSLIPGGARDAYRANSQGFRADRDHPSSVPAGRLRIAAFGDSFTHGDEVAFDDTWEEQLAGLVSGVDVLNFGVPGYGPAQALLRYEEEAERFELPVVLFAIMTGNIKRTVNRFRPFLHPRNRVPMGKPRFVWEGGQLRLLENPTPSRDDLRAMLDDEPRWMRRLGDRDYYYATRFATELPPWPFTLRLLAVGWHVLRERAGPDRPFAGGRYNESSEAFAVLLGICERFHREALRRGSRPIVVMLPLARDMREMRELGRARYAPLIESLRERGIPVVDVAPGFADRPGGPDAGVFGQSHYNAAGNAVVARALRDALAREGVLGRGDTGT